VALSGAKLFEINVHASALSFGRIRTVGKGAHARMIGDDVTGLSSRDAILRDSHEYAMWLRKRVRSGSSCPRLIPMWMDAKATRTGFCREPRRGGECRHGGQGSWSATVVPQLPIMFLMERRPRPMRPAMRGIRRGVYGRTKAEAGVKLLALLPDCCIVANLVAVRNRRQMFSRHDIEAGGKPCGVLMWSAISGALQRTSPI